jgi:hypothetical protein
MEKDLELDKAAAQIWQRAHIEDELSVIETIKEAILFGIVLSELRKDAILDSLVGA